MRSLLHQPGSTMQYHAIRSALLRHGTHVVLYSSGVLRFAVSGCNLYLNHGVNDVIGELVI